MTTKNQPDPNPPEMKYSDSNSADFIFFDGAPTFAAYNGLIAITLSAARYVPDGSKVAVDGVVTAHLRTNIQGALSLRKSIDDALLLARPTEGAEN